MIIVMGRMSVSPNIHILKLCSPSVMVLEGRASERY